jgi:transcriptional regulator with XRE-family HTH domain
MATDICITVGRRIRILRTEKGWTQQVLADHSELSREHLAELEAGNKEAGIRTLQRIASSLDRTLSQLLEGV